MNGEVAEVAELRARERTSMSMCYTKQWPRVPRDACTTINCFWGDTVSMQRLLADVMQAQACHGLWLPGHAQPANHDSLWEHQICLQDTAYQHCLPKVIILGAHKHNLTGTPAYSTFGR